MLPKAGAQSMVHSCGAVRHESLDTCTAPRTLCWMLLAHLSDDALLRIHYISVLDRPDAVTVHAALRL